MKYVTSRLTPDHVEKLFRYFQRAFLEFVADWLEKSNISKLKSVFEATCTRRDGVRRKQRNISSVYLCDCILRRLKWTLYENGCMALY